MDQQPRVQVVLGEAERTDGLLRFVLEAEGFDIVGLASDDQELGRVLRGARPAVVVLDGGISAPAALEARDRSHGAALVVVWPDGVSAAIAEERVDPYEAIADLGDAVRRAAHRAELNGQAERREAEWRDALIRIPEAPDVAPTIVRGVPRVRRERPTPARSRGRRAQVLVAAATWMLILTALTTIAMAVPNALGLFPGRGGARPSLIGSVNRRPTDPRLEEKVTAPIRTGDARRSATCDAPTAQKDRADRSSGRAHPDPVRAHGCHTDQAQSKERTHGGRPDDPGSTANKKQKPIGGSASDDVSQGGGTVVEHGNGGGAGGSGGAGSGSAGKVRPPTGNGGRSGHGNA
jgi:hypothetical protein